MRQLLEDLEETSAFSMVLARQSLGWWREGFGEPKLSRGTGG